MEVAILILLNINKMKVHDVTEFPHTWCQVLRYLVTGQCD